MIFIHEIVSFLGILACDSVYSPGRKRLLRRHGHESAIEHKHSEKVKMREVQLNIHLS